MVLKNQQRLVPDGVSVFDLIMNWKTEIKKPTDPEESLTKKQLAKVVKLFRNKNQVVQSEVYDKHIKDTQAILINPPWDSINIFGPQTGKKSSSAESANRISIEDFC